MEKYIQALEIIMSNLLPILMVTRSNLSGQYLRQKKNGFVSNAEANVCNAFSKIHVERANFDIRLVHLRFTSTNKYWAREVGGPRLHATSKKPEEDSSKPSCTLFEPIQGSSNGSFSFKHVQSGWTLKSPSRSQGDEVVFVNGGSGVETSFSVVDWETFVVLPKYVTFQGDNGKYLRARWVEGYQYLEFSSDDANEMATGYEVTMLPDGHVRVKSNWFDKFWRRSPNWIWADSSDTSNSNKDTLFWPVKVSDDTIAFRNAGNNNFCKRLTTEGKKSCLNAAVSTIVSEARLKVEELVLHRKIFNVEFRLDDARVYDETPIILGSNDARNASNDTNTTCITVKYEKRKSSSFTNSSSLMLGVKTTFTTGLPFIADGEVEVSVEATSSLEWNKTTSETTSAEATYTAKVPPHSKVTVQYAATVGKCDVPFSYTQRDVLSHNGSVVTTQHDDGIYTGLNYYSFHFHESKAEPEPEPTQDFVGPCAEKNFGTFSVLKFLAKKILDFFSLLNLKLREYGIGPRAGPE